MTPPRSSSSAALAWIPLGETIPYVAGWGETGALEAVTEHAELIDRLARTVENAISGDSANDAATAEAVAA